MAWLLKCTWNQKFIFKRLFIFTQQSNNPSHHQNGNNTEPSAPHFFKLQISWLRILTQFTTPLKSLATHYMPLTANSPVSISLIPPNSQTSCLLRQYTKIWATISRTASDLFFTSSNMQDRTFSRGITTLTKPSRFSYKTEDSEKEKSISNCKRKVEKYEQGCQVPSVQASTFIAEINPVPKILRTIQHLRKKKSTTLFLINFYNLFILSSSPCL